jgi:hypothetical protein
MGASSIQPFDNDSAADWVADLCEHESDGMDFIQETLLATVDHGEEYLEAPQAEEAVAAATVVALLTQHPVGSGLDPELHEELMEWLQVHGSHPTPQLLSLAIAGLNRVVTAPSELMELWADEGDTSWRASVEETLARLKALPTKS